MVCVRLRLWDRFWTVPLLECVTAALASSTPNLRPITPTVGVHPTAGGLHPPLGAAVL